MAYKGWHGETKFDGRGLTDQQLMHVHNAYKNLRTKANKVYDDVLAGKGSVQDTFPGVSLGQLQAWTGDEGLRGFDRREELQGYQTARDQRHNMNDAMRMADEQMYLRGISKGGVKRTVGLRDSKGNVILGDSRTKTFSAPRAVDRLGYSLENSVLDQADDYQNALYRKQGFGEWIKDSLGTMDSHWDYKTDGIKDEYIPYFMQNGNWETTRKYSQYGMKGDPTWKRVQAHVFDMTPEQYKTFDTATKRYGTSLFKTKYSTDLGKLAVIYGGDRKAAATAINERLTKKKAGFNL